MTIPKFDPVVSRCKIIERANSLAANSNFYIGGFEAHKIGNLVQSILEEINNQFTEVLETSKSTTSQIESTVHESKMSIDLFIKLLRILVDNKNKRDVYLNTVPSDISSVIFDNTYSSNLSMETEEILKIFLPPDILEEINWFLYDWAVGYTISVNSDNVYIINSIEDFITYLKKTYEST